jgi:hypothetical protein
MSGLFLTKEKRPQLWTVCRKFGTLLGVDYISPSTCKSRISAAPVDLHQCLNVTNGHCDDERSRAMSIALYRQFPTPWSVQELPACFIVRDKNNQPLAHVYCEDGRQLPMRQLTRDEARQIANTIAKLPDLLVQTDRLQADAALDIPGPVS